MKRLITSASLLLLLFSAACAGTDPGEDDGTVTIRDGGVLPRDGGEAPVDAGPDGLPLLGNYEHDLDAVEYQLIGDDSDQLSLPRDVAINPMNPTELWVVNRTTESVTVFLDVGTPNQTSRFFREATGHHFLAQPAALAFGMNGAWASIHETDIETQGPNGTPADFMGPTLWTSNLADFDGGHQSHLDMLHNSPNGMGIAWDHDNVYWVFDGAHRSITMYDFNMDHDLGGTDHSDGIVRRYVQGQVLRVPDVPSGMIMDHVSGLLYIADTGNNRIAALDTTSGDLGAPMGPNYDFPRADQQRMMMDAVLMTVVDGMMVNGMERPSGLDLHEGVLYVADNKSSVIYGFSLEGELLDYLILPLPEGSLMGIDVHDDVLYVADGLAEEVFAIRPKP